MLDPGLNYTRNANYDSNEHSMANAAGTMSVRTLSNTLRRACNWDRSRLASESNATELRCSGSARVPARVSPPALPAAEAWGLPTRSCGASSFLLDDYPQQHRRWLSKGRVLVFCSRSGAVGNYLRQLPTAFAVAALTRRALVLDCDQQMMDRGKPIRIMRLLHGYFRGPHFDWGAPFTLGANVDALELDPGHCGKPDCGDVNYTRMSLTPREGDGGMRLYAGASQTVKRLLEYTHSRQRFAALLGVEEVFMRQLDGCLLRYLLAPTPRLLELMRQTPHMPPPTADGSGLHYSVALHVRLGDYYSTDIDPTWYFKRKKPDLRGGPFFAAPAQLMACVRIAAEDRRRRFGGGAGAGGSWRGSGCLQSVVVSDSPLGEACARAGLDRVAITRGQATHLLASAHASSASDEDISKTFVDWLLLARSATLMSIGPESFSPSSFFQTARQYRDATSPDGDLLLFVGHTATSKACRTMPLPDRRGSGVATLATWPSLHKPGCFQCDRVCSDYRSHKIDNGIGPHLARISPGGGYPPGYSCTNFA